MRKSPKELWLHTAQTKGIACEQREGKTEYIGFIEFPEKGFDRPLHQVFQVIERTIDQDGQMLLVPDIEVNVYWTSHRIELVQIIYKIEKFALSFRMD